MVARAGFAVAVLTLIFSALGWAESTKWLPFWVSALTRPGAIVTALSVVIILEAWAVLKLQGRVVRSENRSESHDHNGLESRFESHDHNDLGWIAKAALKAKKGGMGVR
jgi:hypothetical protein